MAQTVYASCCPRVLETQSYFQTKSSITRSDRFAGAQEVAYVRTSPPSTSPSRFGPEALVLQFVQGAQSQQACESFWRSVRKISPCHMGVQQGTGRTQGIVDRILSLLVENDGQEPRISLVKGFLEQFCCLFTRTLAVQRFMRGQIPRKAS